MLLAGESGGDDLSSSRSESLSAGGRAARGGGEAGRAWGDADRPEYADEADDDLDEKSLLLAESRCFLSTRDRGAPGGSAPLRASRSRLPRGGAG